MFGRAKVAFDDCGDAALALPVVAQSPSADDGIRRQVCGSIERGIEASELLTRANNCPPSGRSGAADNHERRRPVGAGARAGEGTVSPQWRHRDASAKRRSV